MNNEVEDLVQRLRVFSEQFVGKEAAAAKQAADLLEQQSERLAKLEERILTIYSQPVELPEFAAIAYDFDGYGWKYIDNGSGSNWRERVTHLDAHPLYTADQLTKVVQEATARALEAAAKECEKSPSYDWHRFACETATAIRNLIGNVPLRGVK